MNVEINADVLAVLYSAALKGSFGWPDTELQHALTVADDLIKDATEHMADADRRGSRAAKPYRAASC